MATAAPPNNKRSQGGKKIELKLMEKKSNRMVTFSKRRSSIFGKASELSTISGAHVAIMIFSPGGKIYSFGSPSVEAVVERYEAPLPTEGSFQPNPNPGGPFSGNVAANRAERTRRLKKELKQTLDSVESEKMKSQMLDMAWERQRPLWWNKPIKDMDLAQCKMMEQKLIQLKMMVEAAAKNKLPEDSEKFLVGHDYLSMAFPPGLPHLMLNHAGVSPSNDFMSEWINFGDNPSNYIIPGPNSAAAVSPIDFQRGIYSFGGSSSSNFVPMSSSSSDVGPSSHINFSNFTG